MVGGVLETAVSGLIAFKRSLETTGHNISNANTEGYSRQRVELGTRDAFRTGGGYLGQGVDVNNITRVYDQFLSAQLRSSTATSGEAEQYKKMAGQVDGFLADSASGLAPVMQTFFGALHKVADDPTSIAARQVLLADAGMMAQRVNSMNSRFKEIDQQVAGDMTAMTGQVNNYATELADLNVQISTDLNRTGGIQQPNDLQDRRDMILGKLSQLVEVSTVQQPNGMTSVFIGKGQPLVLDSTHNTLSALPSPPPADPQKLEIMLSTPTTNHVISDQVTGGAIGGSLRFRAEVLEPARQGLSNIAETMAKEMNDLHKVGFDLNGVAGTDLFTYNNLSGDLSVNITNPREIAAATDPLAVPGDNRNALAMANLENATVTFQQNGVPTTMTETFKDAYGHLVSQVGSLTHAANVSASAQESLLNNAKSAVANVSGVNLDEEAANLMKFQQSYQAAAQAISASKSMFDTLIGAVR